MASSGNLGKLEGYPEIWESVTSPGTSPFAITVYPVNHRGTADASDDIGTTFGSRGPSFRTNVWKPDIAAPGNRIRSLLSPGSTLEAERPQAVIGQSYLELSGASMAVPLVSGAVALVRSAHPDLQAPMIKISVLAGSQPYQNIHPLAQGRGLLRIDATLSWLAKWRMKEETLARATSRSLDSGTASLNPARFGTCQQL